MRVSFRLPLVGSTRASVPDAQPDRPASMPLRQSSLRPVALGRIAPFLAEKRLAPIFHLHIPRCAGKSLVRFLGRIYGQDGVLVAAEDIAGEIVAGRHAPVLTDCVSGSIPLMRWMLFRDADAYARVTILRDPWARLVSQINHLAALGAAAGPDGSATQLLAVELAGADFTSRVGLERLRRRVSLAEGGLDNLQTRMLLTGTMSAMVKPLQARDVERAVQELQRFAVIGFCEDQVAVQRAVLAFVGSDQRPMPEFEASGRAGLLSARNDLAREVLEPWIAFDRDLYRRARALVAARQPV